MSVQFKLLTDRVVGHGPSSYALGQFGAVFIPPVFSLWMAGQVWVVHLICCPFLLLGGCLGGDTLGFLSEDVSWGIGSWVPRVLMVCSPPLVAYYVSATFWLDCFLFFTVFLLLCIPGVIIWGSLLLHIVGVRSSVARPKGRATGHSG